MSIGFGLITTSTSLSLNKLHFKDIFKYKSLNAGQKELLKLSYLFGLFSALHFGINSVEIFNTKYKSKNCENNIEVQNIDNNSQLSMEIYCVKLYKQ